MAPVTGGLITGVDPNPAAGGATTPLSGIGRTPPPSANGFSLRGRAAGPSEGPGGNTGASLRGRTTSGTLCPNTGPDIAIPTPTTAKANQKTSTPSRADTCAAPRCL